MPQFSQIVVIAVRRFLDTRRSRVLGLYYSPISLARRMYLIRVALETCGIAGESRVPARGAPASPSNKGLTQR
jgi:hypothetical protein